METVPHSKPRKTVVGALSLVGLAIAVGAIGSGVAGARNHVAKTASSTTYTVSASLHLRPGGKAPGASGTFSGTLTAASASATTGKLAWKLTLKNLGTSATGAQIRSGGTATGAILAKLCAPCTAAAHGTAAITSAAFAALKGKKAFVDVQGKTASLDGAASFAGGAGGGGLVVPTTPALVSQGKALAQSRGCAACHTINGQPLTGPTWKGLYLSHVPQTSGGTVVATAQYLFNVIEDASTLKVTGYDATVMSEVIGPGSVSAPDAKALVAYIETLK
jgi:mono/diheme cytochrome c family protein